MTVLNTLTLPQAEMVVVWLKVVTCVVIDG